MVDELPAASIVGEDSLLSGQVVGKDLLVLGRFEGSVELSGVFRIGKRGYARAQVRSNRVELEGTFEGEIATGLFVLGETARAQGLFQVRRLRMHEGAVLNGSVNPPAVQEGAREEPALSVPDERWAQGQEGEEDDLERWEGEGGPPKTMS